MTSRMRPSRALDSPPVRIAHPLRPVSSELFPRPSAGTVRRLYSRGRLPTPGRAPVARERAGDTKQVRDGEESGPDGVDGQDNGATAIVRPGDEAPRRRRRPGSAKVGAGDAVRMA